MRNLPLVLLVLVVAVGAYYALSAYLRPQSETSTEPVGHGAAETGNISLAGSSWKWVYTDLASRERVKAPAGYDFVLTFTADGKVTSSTDCNSLSGVYVQDREVLSLGQFVMTKMYCASSMEATYVKHLGLINSFNLSGDTLTMNLNRDYGTMVFTRQ